ncbi:MAG: class I SAM-dependent methyltransferase [Oscillospiraceae bacterium]|nr:class I SAM-dependent methyltransferase [Oscillospiraceae bacterium]
MFWDRVAGIYDIYVNVINRRTHIALKKIVEDLVSPRDDILECACGTGMLTAVLARKCRWVTATDFSDAMLKKAKRNCSGYLNITYENADICHLPYPDESFDKVVAGNVIHLLDDPYLALRELDRVCIPGGLLIIPTYMNKTEKSEAGAFVKTVGKAGADFKRQFTPENYAGFFREAGYRNVTITLADGRIPCAVAAVRKEKKEQKENDLKI